MLFTSDEIELIKDIASKSLLFDDNILRDTEFMKVKQSLKEFIRERNKKGKSTVRKEILEIFEDKVNSWFENEELLE